MTTTDERELVAGEELNATMAVDVMGWEELEVGYWGTADVTPRQRELCDWMEAVGVAAVGKHFIDADMDFYIAAGDWDPSRSLVDAWRVVEKLVDAGCKVNVMSRCYVLDAQLWGCSVITNAGSIAERIFYNNSTSPEMAICLVAAEIAEAGVLKVRS